MKIAYFVNRFPELSETFILNEIVGLSGRGLQIEVFALWATRPEIARLLSKVMAGSRFVVHRADDLDTVVDILTSRRFDHIHAHFAAAPAKAARHAAESTGIAYSVTAHAFDIFKPNRDLVQNLNLASFVVTVCEYNRLQLTRMGVAGPIHVVPCGIDPRFFKNSAGREPRDNLIVAVGRLVPKKGFPDLVRVSGHLRDLGVRHRCEIIGAGPEEPFIRGLITQMALQDHVSLRGARTQAEVRAALERANVFALPAKVDGSGDRDSMPQVLKEAMSMELPVVTTNVGGIPELVDSSCGIVVPSGDTRQFAEAIMRLLASPYQYLRSLGRAGRARVCRRFRSDQQVEAMRKLFHAS